jgi:hypothetical protein
MAVAIIAAMIGVWLAKKPATLRLEFSEEFSAPVKVRVENYSGDICEPFISRDGKYLFFNNSENMTVNTDLFYAEKNGTDSFDFQGEVFGVNSPKFDAVPSMDLFGSFFYTSLKDFSPNDKAQNLVSIYTGKFKRGLVEYDHKLIGNFFPTTLGWVIVDGEVSPDGSRFYYTKSFFENFNLPVKKSDIGCAISKDKMFVDYADNEKIFAHINTEDNLEYSPSITSDGLELFFTRKILPKYSLLHKEEYQILHSKRGDRGGQFTKPRVIKAITTDANRTEVAAPSVSYNGQTLYYHCRENGRFVIYKVKREN